MSDEKQLRRRLSPLGAWAYAIGTSIGWGSLVVTSKTYLIQAGPMGSVLGLVIGALIMLVIALNYAYAIRRCPEAGGAYTYAREAFGYDQGFLTAWFLSMTYFAMLWANATSLPLFGRIFLGGVFRFGKLYTLFGYDIYLGEALLSTAAILLAALLCAWHERFSRVSMSVMALLFTAGITVCFFAAAVRGNVTPAPAYVPDASAISQIVKIAVISPWAFIGFENISHGAEELRFGADRMRRVLVVAVVSTLALYVLVTLMSVAAYPARYANWLEYIRDLDNLDGIEALPAFYAAHAALGDLGVKILMLALLALICTSLIGNLTALSRLFFALARDRILPRRYAHLTSDGVPARAVWLAAGVSCLIPLVGRTAIGWIVDVTTIGATLIYGFASASAAELARRSGDVRARRMGLCGLVAMVLFGIYILAPNLVARGSLAKETFLLFIVWSVLGFLFFRTTLSRDKEGRFGKSVIVWVALLALVLFTSLVWMRQSMIDSSDVTLANIQDYYLQTELNPQRV